MRRHALLLVATMLAMAVPAGAVRPQRDALGTHDDADADGIDAQDAELPPPPSHLPAAEDEQSLEPPDAGEEPEPAAALTDIPQPVDAQPVLQGPLEPEAPGAPAGTE